MREAHQMTLFSYDSRKGKSHCKSSINSFLAPIMRIPLPELVTFMRGIQSVACINHYFPKNVNALTTFYH